MEMEGNECLKILSELIEHGASQRMIRRVALSVRTDGRPDADFHREVAKAFARLEAPRPTDLEKAERVIVRAARLLDQIVTGSLKDNGTDYDKLTAASIRRHLPGIVGSAIQLGIDVRKVEAYFKGANNDSVSFHLGQQ